MFIFLDESGNFTKHNHEEYFVIASFTIGDQRRTDKALKAWFKSKRFPRKMRHQSEIKWSASITSELRIKTLKYIAKQDVRIRYGYLKRSNIPSNYKNKKNKINTGELYTTIVGEILQQYLPANDPEIRIFCDQRKLKGMTKGEFESSIIAKLLPYSSPSTKIIQVEMVDSTLNANMQLVDWLAGALRNYYEGSPSGAEYFSILKNNLLAEGTEFFKQF